MPQLRRGTRPTPQRRQGPVQGLPRPTRMRGLLAQIRQKKRSTATNKSQKGNQILTPTPFFYFICKVHLYLSLLKDSKELGLSSRDRPSACTSRSQSSLRGMCAGIVYILPSLYLRALSVITITFSNSNSGYRGLNFLINNSSPFLSASKACWCRLFLSIISVSPIPLYPGPDFTLPGLDSSI